MNARIYGGPCEGEREGDERTRYYREKEREEQEAEEALELARMADVLLQPSKTEGFGMPVLEAQMLGVPAITTAFAAMADYTMYGYSVPSVQPAFYSEGWVATPSLDGVADALKEVATKFLEEVQIEEAHLDGVAAAL